MATSTHTTPQRNRSFSVLCGGLCAEPPHRSQLPTGTRTSSGRASKIRPKNPNVQEPRAIAIADHTKTSIHYARMILNPSIVYISGPSQIHSLRIHNDLFRKYAFSCCTYCLSFVSRSLRSLRWLERKRLEMIGASIVSYALFLTSLCIIVLLR